MSKTETIRMVRAVLRFLEIIQDLHSLWLMFQ